MSEENPFNTPAEEVKRLAGELRETKEILREVSKRLSQIEIRVQRSFPSLLPRRVPKNNSAEAPVEKPTLTSEQVMQIYEELVLHARNGEQHAVHERLAALNMEDLNFLRRELGASLGKKRPSRRSVEEAIIGRVRESVALSKHTDRNQIIEESGDITSLSQEEDKKKE